MLPFLWYNLSWGKEVDNTTLWKDSKNPYDHGWSRNMDVHRTYVAQCLLLGFSRVKWGLYFSLAGICHISVAQKIFLSLQAELWPWHHCSQTVAKTKVPIQTVPKQRLSISTPLTSWHLWEQKMDCFQDGSGLAQVRTEVCSQTQDGEEKTVSFFFVRNEDSSIFAASSLAQFINQNGWVQEKNQIVTIFSRQ